MDFRVYGLCLAFLVYSCKLCNSRLSVIPGRILVVCGCYVLRGFELRDVERRISEYAWRIHRNLSPEGGLRGGKAGDD